MPSWLSAEAHVSFKNYKDAFHILFGHSNPWDMFSANMLLEICAITSLICTLMNFVVDMFKFTKQCIFFSSDIVLLLWRKSGYHIHSWTWIWCLSWWERNLETCISKKNKYTYNIRLNIKTVCSVLCKWIF